MDATIDHVETPDELTVQQFLPPEVGDFIPESFHAVNALGTATICSPTSTELYAQETNDLEDCANQVGWGPCLLESWQGDERFTLVPWEDFPVNPLGGEKGPTKITELDKMVFIKYGDPSSMRMALETGQLDIAAQYILRSDVESLQENPDITVDFAPGLGYCQVLRVNYNFPPLNDTRVRKAIALAVDPDEIVDKLSFGTFTTANTVVRKFQPYYLPVFEEMRNRPMEDRIAEAQQLMAEAGYSDGFDTEFWFSAEEQTREIATILQAQLEKIGIHIEIKTLERAAYLENRNAGLYPMCFRGWTLDYVDANSEIWYQLFVSYGKDSPYPSQSTTRVYGWDKVNNTYISKLVEQGKELYDPAGDPPEREAIYHELQQLMYDEAIVLPLYYDSFFIAWNNQVKDYIMWKTIDMCSTGVWNAYKEIPEDWETREPPV
jgi:peptide/nickel transport system substrate-binding protein